MIIHGYKDNLFSFYELPKELLLENVENNFKIQPKISKKISVLRNYFIFDGTDQYLVISINTFSIQKFKASTFNLLANLNRDTLTNTNNPLPIPRSSYLILKEKNSLRLMLINVEIFEIVKYISLENNFKFTEIYTLDSNKISYIARGSNPNQNKYNFGWFQITHLQSPPICENDYTIDDQGYCCSNRCEKCSKNYFCSKCISSIESIWNGICICPLNYVNNGNSCSVIPQNERFELEEVQLVDKNYEIILTFKESLAIQDYFWIFEAKLKSSNFDTWNNLTILEIDFDKDENPSTVKIKIDSSSI